MRSYGKMGEGETRKLHGKTERQWEKEKDRRNLKNNHFSRILTNDIVNSTV